MIRSHVITSWIQKLFTRWLFSLFFFSSLFSGLAADLHMLAPVCPPLFILPLVLTFTPLPTTSPRRLRRLLCGVYIWWRDTMRPTLFCFSARSPAQRPRKERETRKRGGRCSTVVWTYMKHYFVWAPTWYSSDWCPGCSRILAKVWSTALGIGAICWRLTAGIVCWTRQ